MKKIYIVLVSAIMAILSGCYDDKGNYDYTELSDMEISISQTTFNRAVGSQLKVSPSISCDIPDNDLIYNWEVFVTADILGTGHYGEFHSISEGKELDYACLLTTYMPAPGSYTLRLHAKQISNGRDFYSKAIILSLTGVTGLMVLHDDGEKSDIGIISATEFLTNSDEEIETEIFPAYYSSSNEGRKIEGKGKFITQLQGGIASYSTYANVIAVTDKENVNANYGGLVNTGKGWNGLFYGGLNQGKPEGFYYSQMNYQYCNVMFFDGGECYGRQSSEYVLRPQLGHTNSAVANGFDLAPFIIKGTSSAGIQDILFDRANRSFLAVQTQYALFSSSSESNLRKAVLPLSVTGKAFDPSDMQADLEYAAAGGLDGHALAIMKRDDGSRFMAELYAMAGKTYSDVPVAIYEISNLTDYTHIFQYAFVNNGNTSNACYYATPTGVYRFSVDGNGTPLSAQPLQNIDGSLLDFTGEQITMIKYMSLQGNDVLLVGTYNSSSKQGTLHSLSLDITNGSVNGKDNIYTGFGYIRDIYIKNI